MFGQGFSKFETFITFRARIGPLRRMDCSHVAVQFGNTAEEGATLGQKKIKPLNTITLFLENSTVLT